MCCKMSAPLSVINLLPVSAYKAGKFHYFFIYSEEEDIIPPVTNPSIGSGGSKTTMEPNIDFELDIKVFIDSGKCVLHPKDSKEDELKRWGK